MIISSTRVRGKGSDLTETLVAALLLAVMIYFSGDTMVGMLNQNLVYAQGVLTFGVLAVMIIREFKIISKVLFAYMALCMLIVLSMLANHEFAGYTMFLYMGVALLFVCRIRFDAFCTALDWVVFCLCVLSLVGTVIFLFFSDFFYANFKTNSFGLQMSNLWFTVFVSSGFDAFGERLPFRNYGIFREPGMFAVYIGFALLIQLFKKEKPSIAKIVIYLLTLVTTRSTTGFAAIGFLLCGWMLFGKKSKEKHICTMIFALGILAVLLFKFDLVKEQLIKLDINGYSGDSIRSRLSSAAVGFIVAFRHPLFGAGALGSQRLYDEIAPELYGGGSFANMFAYLMSSFGFIFIAIVVIGIWGMNARMSGKKLVSLGLLVFVFLLLCGQSMTYQSVFFIFVFYGWEYIELPSCQHVRMPFSRTNQKE